MNIPDNKVTPEFLDSQIKDVEYHKLGERLTHCTITVQNGFTFSGESSCVAPANYNKELGQELAYEQAYAQLWLPYGFLLREQLQKESTHEV